MSITDEQLQAIEKIADTEISHASILLQGLMEYAYETGFHECGYDPLEVIKLALRERDATIACLSNDALSLKLQLEQAQQDIAELRKPVALEPDEEIEKIRNDWPDRNIGAMAQAVCYLLSAYDSLAQEVAGYANAHAVLMVERDTARTCLLQAQNAAIDLTERERQLRWVIDALVAAGHVSQEKVDQAIEISAAFAQPQQTKPPEVLNHTSNEHGDCVSWCKACERMDPKTGMQPGEQESGNG